MTACLRIAEAETRHSVQREGTKDVEGATSHRPVYSPAHSDVLVILKGTFFTRVNN